MNKNLPPLVRPLIVVSGVLLWTLLLLPVQMIAIRFSDALAKRIPRLYHRGVRWFLGIHVECRGDVSNQRPTLFVSNHVSWLDIIVLGSLMPVSFIAKEEVSSWPLFGLLAKLQRSVFIERTRERTADQRNAMQERLILGDNLLLFPEGTSGDGLRLLPFKTAFFSLAEEQINGTSLAVQPISLTFAALDNLPVGRRAMSLYAWVGDQDLISHLKTFLTLGPSIVVVTFHQPVTIEGFSSRKILAAHCREAIAEGIDTVLSGQAPAKALKLPTRYAKPLSPPVSAADP